jgi:hypothetical protein
MDIAIAQPNGKTLQNHAYCRFSAKWYRKGENICTFEETSCHAISLVKATVGANWDKVTQSSVTCGGT